MLQNAGRQSKTIADRIDAAAFENHLRAEVHQIIDKIVIFLLHFAILCDHPVLQHLMNQNHHRFRFGDDAFQRISRGIVLRDLQTRVLNRFHHSRRTEVHNVVQRITPRQITCRQRLHRTESMRPYIHKHLFKEIESAIQNRRIAELRHARVRITREIDEIRPVLRRPQLSFLEELDLLLDCVVQLLEQHV